MNIRDICASLLLLALPLGVSAQSPSTDGLIAYWKFDETSGITAMDRANSYDATLNSGASFAVGQGLSGGALQVDDISGGANVPSFDLSGDDMTISAWIKADDNNTGATRRIIGKSSSSHATDLSFLLNVTSQKAFEVKFNLNGSSANASSRVNTVKLGIWQHVAVTYNGVKLRLYVDGTEVASSNASGLMINRSNMSLGIGNRPSAVGNDHPFDGLIDELRVYNRSLSSSEVSFLQTEEAYRQLPVTFTGLRASPTISGVELDWTVEDQRDNAGFAVERAADGQRDFTEVGFVPAHARGDYRYTDLTAPAGRTLYYRLRQVDHDGSEMYSDLVKVNSGGGPQLQIFPNPASVSMRIAGSGSYIILDAYGRRVMEGTAAFDQDISVADLSAGTYTLLLNQTRARFVKL